ncbi:MAG: WD40 repeat domain-containing protein [Synechococcaceae cyanobacterium SM1_2_3]|nr:WD40 repeat domain-containing protein [Synechococcaceae cyanobacterium SM1_2_3]
MWIEKIAKETDISERKIRGWCKNLITPQGIRNQVPHGADQSQGLGSAIDKLVGSHLIRSEDRRGDTWYELAHDRLIKPVQDNNKEWRKSNLSVLQQQSEMWNENDRPDRLLLLDKTLREAGRWLNTHTDDLNSIDMIFYKKSQEIQSMNNKIKWATKIVLLLVAIAIIIIIYFYSIAVEQASVAQEKTYKAEEQAGLARTSALIAKKHEAIAEAELAKVLLSTNQIQGLVHAIDAVRLSSSVWPLPVQIKSSLLSAVQRTRERNALSGPRSPIKAVAIAGAHVIVSATEIGEIWLFSRNGNPLSDSPFGDGDTMIRSVAISPDSQTIFVESLGVRLWSLDKKEWVEPSCEESLNAVAISSVGVVTQVENGNKAQLLSWDCKPLSEPFGEGVDQYRTPVAISPDGHTVLIADATGKMQYWSRNKMDEPFQLQNNRDFQHPGGVRSVAISDGGQTVVSLSNDQMIQLWSGDGDKIGEPFQHPGGATSVAISADGQTVVSGGENGTVRLWARDIGLVGKPFPNEVGINSVAISRNGQTVVSGNKEGVWLWSQDGQQVRGPFPHPGVTSVAISADGQTVASQGNDDQIRLWSLDGKEVSNPLPSTQQRDHGQVHTQVAISADGQTVVGGGREVRVWHSWRDGSPPIEWPNPYQWNTAVAISADGQTIASSDETGSVQLWSPDGKSLNEFFQTAQERMQYKPMEMGNIILANVAISDNGWTVVSAGNKSGGVRLWSRDGRLPDRSFADDRWIWSVAISSYSETVVSGDAAGKIQLWSRDGLPLGEPFQDRGRGFFFSNQWRWQDCSDRKYGVANRRLGNLAWESVRHIAWPFNLGKTQ